MMLMNERQKDALSEVVNIAFSRAAASLSELTGQRVVLEVPRVSVHPIADLHKVLNGFVHGEIASVHQIFSGSLSGDALLLLNQEGAAMLTDLLTDGTGAKDRLYESDREVLMEVGNILLNACLGTFGNMLKVHITFAVPRLHLEALDDLLHSLAIGKDEIQYALVVFADFKLRDSEISGFLVIILGVTSLDRMLQAITELG